MASMDVSELKDRYEGDLSLRYRDEYLQVKIEDAEALIAGDHPTVAARLVSGDLLPQNYNRVVSNMVLRVIRNPDGFLSESEGGVGITRNAAVASGDMWITDREIFTLTGIMPQKAGSTLPGTASIGLDTGWGQ